MNGATSDFKAWPIAVLRVYAGIFFVYYGVRKLGRSEPFNISGFLEANLDNAFSWYQPVIENILIPNASLFSMLVALGETALGVALILGLATRYAALAGAFMVANFWFAQGGDFFDAKNQDVYWMITLLVLALIPAGKIMGLDQGLSRKYRFLN